MKRRHMGNPWFKSGKIYRSAVDVLRTAQRPMTVRQISASLLAGKKAVPSRGGIP
jgi:hypothetical protein